MIRFHKQRKLQIKLDMPFLHKHIVIILFSTEDTEKALQQACQELRVYRNRHQMSYHPPTSLIKMNL